MKEFTEASFKLFKLLLWLLYLVSLYSNIFYLIVAIRSEMLAGMSCDTKRYKFAKGKPG